MAISVGDNERSKYWLSVLNGWKNRGVKDVRVICADGLTGIKEEIAADLKTVYQAADEKKELDALERVTEKWTPKYPNAMKRWRDKRL